MNTTNLFKRMSRMEHTKCCFRTSTNPNTQMKATKSSSFYSYFHSICLLLMAVAPRRLINPTLGRMIMEPVESTYMATTRANIINSPILKSPY